MKKTILGIIIITMCLVLTGCNKAVAGNKAFGEYTGIYKLNDVEFKIAHYKNTVLLLARKNDEPYGNSTIYLKDNKFEDMDCKFEFKKNALKVTTKKNNIPSGTYIRIKPYTTKEIYKEYLGDISYINKNNGIYTNETTTIYTVRSGKDTVRIANYYKESGTNIDIPKKSETEFNTKFFEDEYTLKYNNDELEVSVNSNDENTRALSGNYKKKSEMKAEEVIKIFVFNGYEEK